MTDTILEQAQRLVDQLTPHDQVRLLAYLASRLAQAVPAPQAPRPSAPSTGRRLGGLLPAGGGTRGQRHPRV